MLISCRSRSGSSSMAPTRAPRNRLSRRMSDGSAPPTTTTITWSDMSLQVIVVVVAAAQVVEIHQLGAARLVQGFLVVPDLQPHFAGDLGLGRRAFQALLESMDRVFDISLALACRARQPIAGPQLVKHRSANPAGRVDLERGPVGLLEPVDRIHQADHPGLNHVVQFDVGRQPCDHLVRNATHQRRVLLCAIILTLERAARVVDESLILQETVSTAVSPARSQRGMLRQRTRRTRRSIAETSCTLPASDVLAPSSRAPLAASLEYSLPAHSGSVPWKRSRKVSMSATLSSERIVPSRRRSQPAVAASARTPASKRRSRSGLRPSSSSARAAGRILRLAPACAQASRGAQSPSSACARS